ncbi:MAG: hypothetical protein CMP30_02335 [Roseibacillus sp.]|nr:hypothetical protein [Roseibacillus sp.]
MSEDPSEPEEMSEEEIMAYAAELKGVMVNQRKEEKRSLLIGGIVNSVRIALCLWGAFLAAKWLISFSWAPWWLFPFVMGGALLALLALTMLFAEFVGKTGEGQKKTQPEEEK